MIPCENLKDVTDLTQEVNTYTYRALILNIQIL